MKFSNRLVSSPAVITSILTPHMRKMMKQLMAGKEETGMNNIPVTLELSPKHHIVTTLHTIKDSNETVARIAVEQLFDNACIAAGTLDDPRTLLSRLNKVLEMFIYQGAGFDYSRNEYVKSPGSPAVPAESKPDEEKPADLADEQKLAGVETVWKHDTESLGKSKFEEVKKS